MKIDLDPATGGSIVHLSVEETGTILSALALGMITAKKTETRLAFDELHKQFRGETTADDRSFKPTNFDVLEGSKDHRTIPEPSNFAKRMENYWENPR